MPFIRKKRVLHPTDPLAEVRDASAIDDASGKEEEVFCTAS